MGRKKGSKRVDKGRYKTIYDMYLGGMKISHIAKVLRMPQTTISSIVKRENVQNASKILIRKALLCARFLRRLRRQLNYNPFKTLSQITVELNACNGI